MRYNNRNKNFYWAAIGFNSFGDAIQSVGIVWVVYQMFKDPFLISSYVASGYAPGIILASLLGKFSDKGSPDKLFLYTNITLGIICLAVAFVTGFSESQIVVATALFAGQGLASCAAVVSKASINRVVRYGFAKTDVSRAMSVGSTISLICQLVGSGIAGLLIVSVGPIPCLLFNAVSFTLAGFLVFFIKRRTVVRGIPLVKNSQVLKASPTKQILKDPALRSILVFTIPSSGGLKLLVVLLAPLAARQGTDSAALFSILNMSVMAGGSAAGILLASRFGSLVGNLRYGLIACAVVALTMCFSTSSVMLVLQVLALSFVVTSHILAVQIISNAQPADHLLGSFISLRTAAASAAKVAFALFAGALASSFGISAPLVAFALICAAMGFAAWFVYAPRR